MYTHLDQSTNRQCLIDTLPEEVLVAIFLAGSESMTLDDEFSFPMVVSAVSWLWRDIAINTPSLWSRIVINLVEQTPVGYNIPLFFQRSMWEPLYIKIHLPYSPYTSRADTELSDAISINTDRIREMVVLTECMRDFHKFVNPFHFFPFPILSRLEVESIDGDSSPHLHKPLFTGSRHIKSLVFPKCLECAPIGCGLTHLEMRSLVCTPEEWTAMFLAVPSLHTLTLRRFEMWREEEAEPIVVPSLHTLNLIIDNHHSLDGVCNCPCSSLVTPNLVNLTVRWIPEYGSFHFPQHFHTLPKIKNLELRDFCVILDDALMIQKWSTLTHIKLIDTEHTCLWSNFSSSDPWRNLTTITINHVSLARRAMVEAIRRSYRRSPRTIVFNLVDMIQEFPAELQSELPNVVIKSVKQEKDPFIQYDAYDYIRVPLERDQHDIRNDGFDTDSDEEFYDPDLFDEGVWPINGTDMNY